MQKNKLKPGKAVNLINLSDFFLSGLYKGANFKHYLHQFKDKFGF